MGGNPSASDGSPAGSVRPHANRSAAGKYKAFLGLTIATLILASPVLLYGPMPVGHDTNEHFNYTRRFAEQFWQGELFPHWLLNMNHGLGSPTFFVFPPLPSYVYSLLLPVGKAFHFSAFSGMAFLALYISGISAFLWIRTMASSRVAFITAVLYLLMPYHLAMDFYRRTALPECWGLAWMPLVLYFTTQVIRGKRWAFVGLAVAYDLMILSHLVTVFMFSLIPLLVAATLPPQGRRIRSILLVAGGMLLGTLLSCFYFLPALFHSRYFPVAGQGISLPDNLFQFWMVRYGISHSADFISNLCLTMTETAVFIAFCAALAYRRSSTDQKKQIAFWLAVCVVPLLLMSHYGILLWQKLPFLLNSVQFPWRLNVVLCIAALPITAILLSEISWPLTFPQGSSVTLLILLVGTWLISCGVVLKDYPRRFYPQDPVSESDGWYPSWKVPGTDSASAFQASLEPKVRFVSGNGIANVLLWKPRRLEFETNAETGGPVLINQFYYPEWRADVGEGRSLKLRAAIPQGLLEVEVPPGRQTICLEIPVSLAERLGRWLSGLCMLLCIVSLALRHAPLKPVSPPS